MKSFHKSCSHTLQNLEVSVVSLKHEGANFYLYIVLDEYCLIKIERTV
jgi:hypothetical protein